jgi:hypothetical protein
VFAPNVHQVPPAGLPEARAQPAAKPDGLRAIGLGQRTRLQRHATLTSAIAQQRALRLVESETVAADDERTRRHSQRTLALSCDTRRGKERKASNLALRKLSLRDVESLKRSLRGVDLVRGQVTCRYGTHRRNA